MCVCAWRLEVEVEVCNTKNFACEQQWRTSTKGQDNNEQSYMTGQYSNSSNKNNNDNSNNDSSNNDNSNNSQSNEAYNLETSSAASTEDK